MVIRKYSLDRLTCMPWSGTGSRVMRVTGQLTDGSRVTKWPIVSSDITNRNWHPISRTVSELSQLIVQILDTLLFWATPWRLRDNVLSSWAHWKAYSGLPISVNWTFFATGVTTEALRAKIDRKSAISLQYGQFDPPKFQVGLEGTSPPIIFARMVRP